MEHKADLEYILKVLKTKNLKLKSFRCLENSKDPLGNKVSIKNKLRELFKDSLLNSKAQDFIKILKPPPEELKLSKI